MNSEVNRAEIRETLNTSRLLKFDCTRELKYS